MNSLLPNMRLVGLDSHKSGKDYFELSQQIDQAREELGYDLGQESVFFFYSQFPDECVVARSVIGPLKKSEKFKVWDWIASPVERVQLVGRTWDAAIQEVEKCLRLNSKKDAKIILQLRRKIESGELSLSLEAFLHN